MKRKMPFRCLERCANDKGISIYILQTEYNYSCILLHRWSGDMETLSTHSTREEAKRALESYKEDYL